MIEQKVSKLNSYFEEQIALCGQRNKELLVDNRTDEATFEKVKANVPCLRKQDKNEDTP